jgi:hypothetical protein
MVSNLAGLGCNKKIGLNDTVFRLILNESYNKKAVDQRRTLAKFGEA